MERARYIVTDKHPLWKEGVILTYVKESKTYAFARWKSSHINLPVLYSWVTQGYVEAYDEKKAKQTLSPSSVRKIVLQTLKVDDLSTDNDKALDEMLEALQICAYMLFSLLDLSVHKIAQTMEMSDKAATSLLADAEMQKGVSYKKKVDRVRKAIEKKC